MKSTDFRIGNYAQDQNGNLLRVCTLGDDNRIEFTVVDRSKFPLPEGWHAEPIPITEKLLRNLYCSFVHFKRYALHDIPVVFTKHPGNDSLLCFVNGFSLGNIRFLHQLQNLHFEMAARELEFKNISDICKQQ